MNYIEALQLIATGPRPDGTWNRDREACRQIAAEALGWHNTGSMTTTTEALRSLLARARKHLPLAAASWHEGEAGSPHYAKCVDEVLSLIKSIDAALSAIDAATAAAPSVTGGSPEHLLQDQDRGLSRWLADKPDARLHAREAAAAIAAPSVEPVAQRGPTVKHYCCYGAAAEVGCDDDCQTKRATPQAQPAALLHAPQSCPTHETVSGNHVICRLCGEVWPAGAERACVRAEKLLIRAAGITPQEGANG